MKTRIASALLPLVCLVQAASAAAPRKENASKVDALFQEFNRPDVPGAGVIIIQDGKVLYKKAYGLANVEDHLPATTRTNYRLASVTKQFTAMAVMILIDRGKLSYDDRLTDFFPDYPSYGKAITVQRLLNHTSGLLAHELTLDHHAPFEPGKTKQLKDRDVLEILKKQDHTYFPPGSEFRYSNAGYAHLALIVEKVSGMTFARFLKKNLFEPLGMKDTLAYEEGISVVRDRAYGYSKSGHGFVRTDQSATSAILGDGGIYTSVEDMKKWDQALYGTKLVRAETLKRAFTPGVLNDGQKTEYGFGWFIGDYRGLPAVHHGGGTMGFRTYIARYPDRRFTVIVLINRNEADPYDLMKKITDLYLF